MAWELREWRRPSTQTFLNEEIDHALLNETAWRPGERVLDVGCGDGRYMTALEARGAAMIGVDLGLDVVARAGRRGLRACGGSAMRLPFADGAFETVVCHKTLYLLDPPADAAAELARVVRPGGRVIFSTSNTASPYARVQAANIGRSRAATAQRWRYGNRWSARQWIAAFRSHGFSTASIYSCNLVWPWVFRVCDTWLIPNEWMRRYARLIRRVARVPRRTRHPHGAAQDYVIEMVRSA